MCWESRATRAEITGNSWGPKMTSPVPGTLYSIFPPPTLGTPSFFCSHTDPLMGLLGTGAPGRQCASAWSFRDENTAQRQLSPGTSSISLEPPGVGGKGEALCSFQLCEGLLGPRFFSHIQFSNPRAHHWLQTVPAGKDSSDPGCLENA